MSTTALSPCACWVPECPQATRAPGSHPAGRSPAARSPAVHSPPAMRTLPVLLLKGTREGSRAAVACFLPHGRHRPGRCAQLVRRPGQAQPALVGTGSQPGAAAEPLRKRSPGQGPLRAMASTDIVLRGFAWSCSITRSISGSPCRAIPGPAARSAATSSASRSRSRTTACPGASVAASAANRLAKARVEESVASTNNSGSSCTESRPISRGSAYVPTRNLSLPRSVVPQVRTPRCIDSTRRLPWTSMQD